METQRHDVVVLGGGLIGMSLAVALARHGLATALVDPAPVATRAALDFDGRAYAVAPGSRNLLAAIGVWDDVALCAEAITGIEVADRTPGPVAQASLHFDPAETGQTALGWIVEDHVLRAALLERVAELPGLAHLAPARAVDVARDPYGAHVRLEDGTVLQAEMVVACDGRRSATAQAAGIEYLAWEYGQTGLVSAIAHSVPHGGMARQKFFPGGPFAVLPLPGDRSALVWSERTAEAARLHALDESAFMAAVAARLGPDYGDVRLVGRRWRYPLSLSLASRFAVARLVVAGDAAHGVHPIAGQGMNLGLRDVAALTEVLLDARRLGLDIGSLEVLARYQQWRRFEASALSLGMDGLNRLFSNQSAPFQALRNKGLSAVTGLPGAKRFFMEAASGTGEDMPALLLGRSL